MHGAKGLRFIAEFWFVGMVGGCALLVCCWLVLLIVLIFVFLSSLFLYVFAVL